MPPNEREVALRAHIRTLLLDYALTHLTRNYIHYTEEFVSQTFAPILCTIPTNASTLPALEPSLHDHIVSTLKLFTFTAYNEQWAANAQSQSLIKRSILPPGPLYDNPTTACWHMETSEFIPQDPPPALTRKARRETPRLGAGSHTTHGFKTLADLSDKLLLPLAQEEVIDEMPKGPLHDAIANRIVVDPTTFSEVHCLLKAALNTRPGCGADMPVAPHTSHCEDFIRSISPSIEPSRPISPPIFARELTFGTGVTPRDIRKHSAETLQDIQSMISMTVEDSQHPYDDDMTSESRFKQDMLIVDGWHTLPVSSSPTPPLEEELDELEEKWLISSSPIRTPIVDMMDEYELPRTQKVGFTDSAATLPGDGQKLNHFLSFLKPIPSTPGCLVALHAKEALSPKSPVSSPHTPRTTSLSMLGQPTSVVSGVETRQVFGTFGEYDKLDVPSSDDSFGLREVMKAIDPHGEASCKRDFDASAYIIRERLDEKDTMLMEVPDLPPPNQHGTSGVTIPNTLRALLVDSTGEGTNPRPHLSFLKKIKGFQSLNLELSWRPFNFGNAMPTHEEVARLAENIQHDCLQFIRDEAVNPCDDIEDALSRLLADVDLDAVSDAQPIPSERWQDEDASSFYVPPDQTDEPLMLTAAERRRLNNLPEPFFGDIESDEQQNLVLGDASTERPSKRFKDAQPPAELPLPKSPPQYLENVDDSGIFLTDWATAETGDSVAGYLQLADSAHGCEGSIDDLEELFADVDPIHFENPAVSGSTAAYDFGDCIDPALLHAEQLRPDSGPQSIKGHVAFQYPHEATLHLRSPASIRSQQTEEPSHAVSPTFSHMLPENDLSGSLQRGHDVNSAKHSLEEFMRLRTKSVAVSVHPAPESSIPDINMPAPLTDSVSLQIPKELIDHATLQAPEHNVQFENWHRYLGSLEVIQKLALTRALSASDCKVQLVEREFLNGADIIVDPHAAIITFPLRSLPTQCDSLNARINQLSWRFSQILVVFETISLSESKASKDSLAINPFSPAVVKAVKKVRRNLEIGEACLDKQEGVRVQFAFPMSVPSAARIIRSYGDARQAEDNSNGLLWDDRHWLDSDYEDPDEHDLAVFDGMNVFAAAVVLSRNSLDDFIDKPPEQRFEEFSNYIGQDRMTAFNRLVARRLEAIQLPSSSPPTTSIDTSNPMTPPVLGFYQSNYDHVPYC